MKKVLFSTIDYCGRPAKIRAIITDANGYLSITGEITPYRCRIAHCCGCIHDEIGQAFPALRSFLWLHLVNLDGSVTYEVENSLYMLANDDETAAQRMLHCTDDEIRELSALVHNGLHRSKTWFTYKDNKPGYEIKSEQSRKVYADYLNKFGLARRRLNAIKDFYGVLAGLK